MTLLIISNFATLVQKETWEESTGSLDMRALHPVIQKLQMHHLLTHLILTWILLTNTNHTTKQVDQDTRNIESIRKIEDLDHQALIVQYHSTVNIENINITVQNITKSINILSIQSMNNAKQIMEFTIGIESLELGMI